MRGGSSKRELEHIANTPGRELAALAYCEELTYHDILGFPPLHTALAENFSQKRVAEIAVNLWTCLKLEQDAIPVAE